MVDDWPIKTFGDAPLEIIDGDRGTNYPSQIEFFTVGHCLFLNAGNVTKSGFRFEDCAFVTAQKDALLRKGKLHRNDVVLTTRGTVGNVAYYSATVPFNHVRINSGMVILRPQASILDPYYLYIFVRSPFFQEQVAALRTGSAQPQLPIRDINRIVIPIPPRADQQAIARILGAIDDKIELNRRMNETLEATARALFKSWFVDFDPVRAKVEGSASDLPQSQRDLFPDAFDETDIGDVPRGWVTRPLSGLVSYLGRGIGPAYVETGGVCVLNQKCIRDGRIDFSKARRHDFGKKAIEGRKVELFDVLVNSTGVGTLGRVAQIRELPEESIVDSHVTVVRAAENVDPHFLGTALLGRTMEIEALGEGSTGQTELSRARLGALPCLVPPEKLQRTFGNWVAPLMSRLVANEGQARTLTSLHDTLLPKLISGELRAKAAEKIVEAVA